MSSSSSKSVSSSAVARLVPRPGTSSLSTSSAYEKAVLAGLKIAQGRGVSRDQVRRFVATRLFEGDASRVDDALLDAALQSNVDKAHIATAEARLPDSRPSSTAATNNSRKRARNGGDMVTTSSSSSASTTTQHHREDRVTFEDSVGSFVDRGDREYQEDRFVVLEKKEGGGGGDKKNSRDLFAAAVYDGHCGAFAAEYLSDAQTGLLPQMLDGPLSGRLLPPRASRSTSKTLFDDYDAKLRRVMDSRALRDEDGDYAGATACILVRNGASIALYNVGDSRAALYDARGNILLHTLDHSPEMPKECRRVTQAGGTVEYDVAGCFRVDGFLAMARSFGDFQLKKAGSAEPTTVLPTPDVFVAPLSTQEPTYAIVASDGLWDSVGTKEAGERLAAFLTSQGNNNGKKTKTRRSGATDKTSEQQQLEAFARQLGTDALQKTRDGDEPADNITVLVVKMDPR